MSATTTEAKCRICGKTFKGAGMSKHLITHLQHLTPEKPDAKPAGVLHLKITGGKFYFLHILVPDNFTFKRLDTFLRKIWLECCGHLSEFMYDWSNTIGMSKKIADVLKRQTTINYVYDMGSSTELQVALMGSYELAPKKVLKDIVILSRNEPYPAVCTVCGKEADCICGYCLYEKENPCYCESCGEDTDKHSCGDECLLPVCNSPRMGECAYTAFMDNDAFAIVDIGQDVSA